MIQIYFDGACEPNPNGTASYGWIIKINGKVHASDNKILGTGEGMTNNVAEYGGLINALEALHSINIKGEKVYISGDSSIVCNAVSKTINGSKNKKWVAHKKFPHLRKLLDKVVALLNGYEFEIKWIPREENTEADDLSKKHLITGEVSKENWSNYCLNCGGKLVIRTGRFGQFTACSNYPKCKFTKKK